MDLLAGDGRGSAVRAFRESSMPQSFLLSQFLLGPRASLSCLDDSGTVGAFVPKVAAYSRATRMFMLFSDKESRRELLATCL